MPHPGLAQGGPSFSPVDGALVATNRGILNFRSGLAWLVILKQQMSSASRWSTDGSELVMWIQPTPGKDGGIGQQLLRLQYQPAPFGPAIAFAVRTGADCLNLRESARTDAVVIKCLRDGSTLTPANVLLPSTNPKMPAEDYIGLRDEQFRTWLHVVTGDGVAGWVDSAYVDWAP